MNTNTTSGKPAGQLTEEQVRAIVDEANIGVLRVALYHETQDAELAAIPSIEWPIRGGALMAFSLPRESHALVREKAVHYLLSDRAPKPVPTKAEAAVLMEMFTGKKQSPEAVDYGYEELAYAEIPRDVVWTKKPDADILDNFVVTIVGAGFSAIAAAIQLDRLGIQWQIIERHSDLGGTWHINNYPEARVDVSTFLYQYKFEKNYPWESYYAPRDELQRYANYIVDKYGLRDRITLNTKLVAAKWSEADHRWTITVEEARGETRTFVSNAIISASGLFNTPKLPDIDGIQSYRGKMFHTTAWDHDYDYSGKRVALIGTGSTGLQLARGVASKASHLTVFQRTASWVTPVKGYRSKISSAKRWLLDNMPGYHNWFTYLNYYAELQMQDFQEVDEAWVAKGGHVNEKNAAFAQSLTEMIRQKVGDRDDLFEKLVPNVVPMARRLVIDNDWYQTAMRDNVSIETGGIQAITEKGIRTNDGVEHEYDLIVLSAGFDVSRYLLPAEYEGVDGVTLDDLWSKDGARAFKGITLPGFPNFFMMYGPNGQARIGSFHSWAENFSRYIAGLLVYMLEQGGDSLCVTRSAYDTYNANMDEAMKGLLWETETGNGYYVNQHGRSGVNMPWSVHDFYTMIQHIDPENYAVSETTP
ncbi:MAG: NAD(P)/FAD-dependent oxidoreductase [Pseudomonadota bacterium]